MNNLLSLLINVFRICVWKHWVNKFLNKKKEVQDIMKIKKGFVLRDVCGEQVVTAEGIDQINFNKLVSMNASAAYLWKSVENSEFDEEALARLLTEKYDVDYSVALNDAKVVVKVWTENGLTE